MMGALRPHTAQHGVVIVWTGKYQPEAKSQSIGGKQRHATVNWNLHDKLNGFTGSFVSTRECVNLDTHTNFTAVL